jgi:plastocyanin
MVNSGAKVNVPSTDYYIQINSVDTSQGPVTLTFFCLLHPEQQGTVTVVPDTTSASNQAQLNSLAAAQAQPQTAAGVAAVANPSGTGANPHPLPVTGPHNFTVWAGTAAGPEGTTNGQVEVAQFLPDVLNIHTGDTVTWVTGVVQDVHTVTFPDSHAAEAIDPLQHLCEPTTSGGTDTRAPNGVASDCRTAIEFETELVTHSFPPLVCNQAECTYASQLVPDTSCTQTPGQASAICSPATLASSGLLTIGSSFKGGNFPDRYAFMFPNAGMYTYKCTIHDNMTGVINVTP